MADIFLSFKTTDTPRVQPLYDALRSAGLTVFWSNSIPIGDRHYQETIIREVETAALVIVAWTNESVMSGPVRQEARQGEDDGKLIQVMLEQIPAIRQPMDVSFVAQKAMLIGWTGDTEHPEWSKLMAAIEARATSDARSRIEAVRAARKTAKAASDRARVAAARDGARTAAWTPAASAAPKTTGDIADYPAQAPRTGEHTKEWFIARDGVSHGPISDSEFMKLREMGHLKPTDLVWRAGLPEWVLATSLPTLTPQHPKMPDPGLHREPQKTGSVDPKDPSTWGKVSRNAPCPCGSGKKYKVCHGKHP